mmetsp:Transcript_6411/g.19392  ORF Transcript_6411/g.19392 Transcript_6411/m.19392 type:complete len:271 (+) Transcript_6411:71-883(+)|eukprot:CAMPEP_0198735000 /NCGR_PEP_ID=MMETSP1475-20131203/56559_1 /TAXON_ID= ORGANISM="Unidentified sp., Strain CCMP1999" /NCGR_SAMPLE_ID=MMETSP1475 /ASSEMBLY_ACC=CAM_ASM_001111 /LENGTH=270 /DNA_ID=CAMNT_0044498587 /DNA_START=38 /DNA_END=853 /DNA_ORIENTATION=+
MQKFGTGVLALRTTAAGTGKLGSRWYSGTAGKRWLSSGGNREVELYQYEVCPFCAKAKAAMDFYKVPYSTIEVNPLSKREMKFTDYKKVPLAIMDGEKVTESDVIMDKVRSLGEKDPPTAEELKWREWSNKQLVILLPPNLYRSLPESWASFKYISANSKFGQAEAMYVRLAGTLFMWSLKGRMMKKYDLKDERKDLAARLDTWVQDALNSKAFQRGDEKPGLADLSVFGMLRSMTGVPTFEFALGNTGVRDWYERMQKAVGPSARVVMK